MKIALTGLHGQGKTTLLNALKEHSSFKDFTFIQSPTRELSKTLPINENGTQDTQIHIMMTHYNNINTTNNIILDRCSIDGLVYTKYFKNSNKIDNNIYKSIHYMHEYIMKHYSYIFYIEPILDICDDGVRSTNEHFTSNIKNIFEETINQLIYFKNIKNIFKIKGTTDERINLILNKINV